MSMASRNPKGIATALVLAAGALTSPSRAESVRTIDAARIVVSDVVPANGESEAMSVELGPAPPPGGSRIVERREVLERLRESGVATANLVMPASVRVVRAARRMSAHDLETETTPRLRAALPPGVTLVSIHFARGVVVPPHATVQKTILPRLPRRAGATKTTVMFEIAEGAELAARIPGTVTLEISERAAQPAVARGGRLDVVIEKGPARVTAVGVALADADIGDMVSVRVDGTQKTLEARVESPQSAKVVRP